MRVCLTSFSRQRVQNCKRFTLPPRLGEWSHDTHLVDRSVSRVQLFAHKKARQNRPQRPHHARQHWCARVACHNVRPTTTIPERACKDMARTPWPSRVTCHHRCHVGGCSSSKAPQGPSRHRPTGSALQEPCYAMPSLDAIACVFATSLACRRVRAPCCVIVH